MNVNTNYSAFFSVSSTPDNEWKRIIEKLWKVYGVRSTGSKSLDKQKLHELEKRDAEKEVSVNSKYLTLTKTEQEEIQIKKKNKKQNNEIPKDKEITKGAELLGKQLFIAIQMKNNADFSDNKKKRDNKYQT